MVHRPGTAPCCRITCDFCRRADAALRTRRGSRRPRSDAGPHLRGARRLCRAVRQAVRNRRKAEHRPAAGHKLRVVRRQQGADAQGAPWGHLSRWREARRSRGQIQHRAAQDAARIEPSRRARARVHRRRSRPDDRTAESVGAFRAAACATGRSRRHDGVAQGGTGSGRQVRRQAGVLGAVPLRRARGAGPDRARALSKLLEQGRHSPRKDHLPADCRLDGTARQSQVRATRLHRAHGALGCAWAQVRQPIQDFQDYRNRLPRHHHQRRKERPGAEESARQGRARARSLRARARPRRHRAGGDGRRGGGRQPVGRARQHVLRQERAHPQARRGEGQGAACRGRCAQSQLHAGNADDLRRAENRAGRPVDGQGSRL